MSVKLPRIVPQCVTRLSFFFISWVSSKQLHWKCIYLIFSKMWNYVCLIRLNYFPMHRHIWRFVRKCCALLVVDLYPQRKTGDQWTLTHLRLVMHICVRELGSIVSDKGLSPVRRQAITWTSADLLPIGLFGSMVSEMLIEILIFSFENMHLNMSFAKWWPFCSGGNELTCICT